MKKKILFLIFLLLLLTACGKTVEQKEEPKEEPVQESKEEQKEETKEVDKEKILVCSNIIDSDYYYMDRHYTFYYDGTGQNLYKIKLEDSQKLTGDAELGDSLMKELEDDCKELNLNNGVSCKFKSDDKTATYTIEYDLAKMSNKSKEEIDDIFSELYDLSLEELKQEAEENDMECE